MYDYLIDRLDILEKKLKLFDYMKFNINYHKEMIQKIKDNSETNITISFETAKSLCESLSKAHYAYKKEIVPETKNDINIQTLHGNIRKKFISLIAPEFDKDIDKIHSNVSMDIVKDRTSNGDICHGRNPINYKCMPIIRQQYYVDFCLSTYKYSLNALIEEIENDSKNEIIYDDEKTKEFNIYLNEAEIELNKLLFEKGIKNKLYSELLYIYDKERYESEFLEFKEKQKEDDEPKYSINLEGPIDDLILSKTDILSNPADKIDEVPFYSSIEDQEDKIKSLANQNDLDETMLLKDYKASHFKGYIYLEKSNIYLKEQGKTLEDRKEIEEKLKEEFKKLLNQIEE